MKKLLILVAPFFIASSHFAYGQNPRVWSDKTKCYDIRLGILVKYDCISANNQFTHFNTDFLAIPEIIDGQNVRGVAQMAFTNKNIVSLKMPNAIDYIDTHAFSYNKIKQVKLPEQLEVIGDHAFEANLLSEIVVPAKVTRVGSRAFAKMPSLRKVIFKNKSVKISEDAFKGSVISMDNSGEYLVTTLTWPASTISLFDTHDETGKTIATFQKVEHPQLGDAWKAPNGKIWSANMGPIDSTINPKIVSEAWLSNLNAEDVSSPGVKKCKKLGAKLPTQKDYAELLFYFDSSYRKEDDPTGSIPSPFKEAFNNSIESGHGGLNWSLSNTFFQGLSELGKKELNTIFDTKGTMFISSTMEVWSNADVLHNFALDGEQGKIVKFGIGNWYGVNHGGNFLSYDSGQMPSFHCVINP